MWRRDNYPRTELNHFLSCFNFCKKKKGRDLHDWRGSQWILPQLTSNVAISRYNTPCRSPQGQYNLLEAPLSFPLSDYHLKKTTSSSILLSSRSDEQVRIDRFAKLKKNVRKDSKLTHQYFGHWSIKVKLLKTRSHHIKIFHKNGKFHCTCIRFNLIINTRWWSPLHNKKLGHEELFSDNNNSNKVIIITIKLLKIKLFSSL